MRKTHKGATLVEVLVSITVFAILSVTMVSCLLLMTRTVTRQEEYVRFEMILSDMKFHVEDENIILSLKNYLNITDHDISADKTLLHKHYTEDFKPTTNPTDYFYKLTCEIDSNNRVLVNVQQIRSNRVVISNSEVTP